MSELTKNVTGKDTESTFANLQNQRLLDIKEFMFYASIGRNNAIKLAHESGSAVRIGRRLLVDRVKFDRWCDAQ